jgi:hypothetical protein
MTMSEKTGAPTDLTSGMPATDSPAPAPSLGAEARHRFAQIADRLIPAAHGMPSAAEVVGDDRLNFVLRARPDLADPLNAALRAELGDDVEKRLEILGRDEQANLAALQLILVAGYYTDKRVRDLIGYAGQEAIEVRSWELPPYLEEGLIDKVLERGPVWRDPATGKRAVDTGAPRTYAERWSEVAGTPQGGRDGRDGT